ncbi:hypothetical protein BDA99DRAFT_558480 [Phascolomyces articulosus]|uniref:Uncharacterized protein n=1 Tax=Phascolomyces articulosus TaxID=60185 RepID=A0AAD5PG61_9FUNG|nr:hypothetical protein BDA99DRAFT_558480 [Phascolomyces articulosus]
MCYPLVRLLHQEEQPILHGKRVDKDTQINIDIVSFVSCYALGLKFEAAVNEKFPKAEEYNAPTSVYQAKAQKCQAKTPIFETEGLILKAKAMKEKEKVPSQILLPGKETCQTMGHLVEAEDKDDNNNDEDDDEKMKMDILAIEFRKSLYDKAKVLIAPETGEDDILKKLFEPLYLSKDDIEAQHLYDEICGICRGLHENYDNDENVEKNKHSSESGFRKILIDTAHENIASIKRTDVPEIGGVINAKDDDSADMDDDHHHHHQLADNLDSVPKQPIATPSQMDLNKQHSRNGFFDPSTSEIAAATADSEIEGRHQRGDSHHEEVPPKYCYKRIAMNENASNQKPPEWAKDIPKNNFTRYLY